MNRTGSWVSFLSGLAAGAILGWFYCFPPTDSSSAAGWAQALGAVAAIVGSVVITRLQMRHAVEREEVVRKNDRVERLDGVIAIAHSLVLACGRTQKAVKDHISADREYREAIRGFQALADGGIVALDRIPLHEPPYASIAREIIVLQRAIYLYKRRMSKLLAQEVDPRFHLGKAEVILNRLRLEEQRLRKRADRPLKARTADGLALD
ncbi:hypothetical protein QCE73_04835 [Caballeronia sp. LZ029]|uniref:hypothetical protein n=1 Tax=Caballeronia sp. LZ029 TaxID=3038564 RepID=UPI00285D8A93|nr:hypothetical protein [Caballeronia sp. LZ029]MDR5742480.1 hypothetical protein [Caballeronia sp. LZ029]